MAITFSTRVYGSETGNTAGLPVPDSAITALGSTRNPAVTVTVGPLTYRSTVAVRNGSFILPLSQALRAESGIKAGDEVEVTLELDTAPRSVDVPEDLASALTAAGLRQSFDALSYSRQRGIVEPIAAAKAAETRARRIAATVAKLSEV